MSESDRPDSTGKESENASEPPELVVDSDWKAQVEKEKELARNQTGDDASADDVSASDESSVDAVPTTESTSPQTQSESSTEQRSGDGTALPPPPPATFDVLVSMLFTQAMTMLGQVPDPVSGQTRVNKAYAKHYIDTLEMLMEKTEGNRTDNESKILGDALHALRMVFINTP